jgi:hypothetical protein
LESTVDMRKSVQDVFFDFSAQHEGFTPFMYCDTLNLVTTGIGNLIDAGVRNAFDISDRAMAPAMSLPWKFKGPGWTSKNPVAADTASQADIKEAWIRTKLQEQNVPGFSQRGGFAYAGLTPLTLDLQGLKTLFNKTLTSFDSTLNSRYPGYESWPADAQLAILSMSWAMGPAFNFPAFKAAVTNLDFRKAAELSFFKGGGGTLENRTGRNRENVLMFTNAADSLKGGVDPDRLFFPGSPATSPGVLPSAAIANISSIKGIGKRVAQGAAPVAAVAAVGAIGWGIWEWWKDRK